MTYICINPREDMAITIEEIAALLDKKLEEKLGPIKKDISTIKKDIKAIRNFNQMDEWDEELKRRGNHTPEKV